MIHIRPICLRWTWRTKSTLGNYLALTSLFMTITFVFTIVYSSSWYDKRCEAEIVHITHKKYNFNGTRSEIIQRFLNVYDLNWEKSSLGDPGMLPSSWMNCKQVHADGDPDLGPVLHWLSTAKIVKSVSGIGGNSRRDIYNGHTAKFQFVLEGGYKALYKVKAYERDQQAGDLSVGRLGADRHNGEIASYHLQRILGFNRAPLAVGRKVNITREILPVANNGIASHVKYNGDDICIEQIGISYKLIPYQKITKTSLLCGKNGVFEGTLMLWLPREYQTVPFHSPVNYEWNINFLNDGLVYPIKNSLAKQMDYVDILLFDYLIQNPDRNAFHFDSSKYSSLLIIDNGKSFGDSMYDWKNMLNAFKARCQIRMSTYNRLKLLGDGVLSGVLRQILSRDPIAPVLWDKHYEALDRRLSHILQTISDCIQNHGHNYVILKDSDIYASHIGGFSFSFVLSWIRSSLKI